MDIRDREELRSLLEPTLGPDATTKLLEEYPAVPPSDLVTRDDLHGLEERLGVRFEQIDRRFEQIDQRFEQNDQRFEQVDRRFERLENRIDRLEERTDERFETMQLVWDERMIALENRLVACFRGELNTALVSQARVMMFTTLGAVASISGVALGIAFGA